MLSLSHRPLSAGTLNLHMDMQLQSMSSWSVRLEDELKLAPADGDSTKRQWAEAAEQVQSG